MTAVASSPERVVDDPDTGPRAVRSWVVPTCTAIVLVLYGASALLFARDGSGTDFHRRQAAALAEGHLDIRPVPVALAELPDPYDASANLDVRLDGVQDLAYRDGRLYSAHGLTVPLLLLPAELLFDGSPPSWAIAVLGAWVGALAGAWMVVQARRRFLPDLPDWAAGSAVLAFGLCGPVWALVSVGNGYEAATAVAFAFTMVGSGLLLRSTDSLPRLARGRAALGSACLALAVGARPTAVVGVAVAAAVAVIAVRSRRSDARPARGHGRWIDVLAVIGPIAVIGGALALANAVRFGAVTEFGFGYQLSVWDMTEYPKGRLAHLAPNLLDYAAAVPSATGSFPWIGLRETVGGDRPSMHTSEPLVGLIFSAPVLVVGAVCAARAGRTMWARNRGLAVAVATAATTGLLGLVAVSLPFNTSALRYAVDGAPMLLLAACGAWAWARQSVVEDRRWLDRAWLTTLGVGILVTAAVQVPT